MTEKPTSSIPVDFDDIPWTKADTLAMTFVGAYKPKPRTWPIDDIRETNGEWRIVTHNDEGHEISFMAQLMRHVPDERRSGTPS